MWNGEVLIRSQSLFEAQEFWFSHKGFYEGEEQSTPEEGQNKIKLAHIWQEGGHKGGENIFLGKYSNEMWFFK